MQLTFWDLGGGWEESEVGTEVRSVGRFSPKEKGVCLWPYRLKITLVQRKGRLSGAWNV